MVNSNIYVRIWLGKSMDFPDSFNINRTSGELTRADNCSWNDGAYYEQSILPGTNIIRENFMISSGLKDANGKDIFVGDFFKTPEEEIILVTFPFRDLYNLSYENNCGKVIGNYYENEDLIHLCSNLKEV